MGGVHEVGANMSALDIAGRSISDHGAEAKETLAPLGAPRLVGAAVHDILGGPAERVIKGEL